MLLAGDEAIKQHNLTPLARLVGYSVVGVEPSIMGVGPVPAIQNLLKVCGKTLNDIELVEVICFNLILFFYFSLSHYINIYILLFLD